jgi:hypothetical protein
MKDSELEKLREEHGPLASTTTPDGRDIVIMKPKGGAMRRFTDKVSSDKGSKYSAAEELVMSCVVLPDKDQARSILRDYEALTLALSAAAQDMSGSEFEIKKS